ncbi:hypothetical protein GGF31_005435 [Allomyces arbusculus]|nr:hypothetical protein GGF31_005435 [Allomyces arbusculus]
MAKPFLASYFSLAPRHRLALGLGVHPAGVAVSLAGLMAADYLEQNSKLSAQAKIDAIAASAAASGTDTPSSS